jgi:hypothetical protein
VFADGNLLGSALSCVSGVPDVVGSIVVCSIGDVRHCVGSSSLDSSNSGLGAAGSSSEDSGIRLLSEGRLSPSNSCILGCVILR